jgi:hypothetical protein
LMPLHRHERVRWCNRLRGWTFRNWRRSEERRVMRQRFDSVDERPGCTDLAQELFCEVFHSFGGHSFNQFVGICSIAWK